jgi:hypothetical protein
VCGFILIRLSHNVVVVGGATAFLTVGIPRVEYLEVLLGAQQVSCDGTLEYFAYIEVPKMSFGEGKVSCKPTKIHPQRFLIKSETIARKTRQKRVK